MTERAKPVLIAGGGIAGLALALSLSKHGFASEILERETTFGDAGAGIQLGPHAVRILQSAGAALFLEPLASAPDAIVIHNGRDGRPIGELPLGSSMSERLGAPYWTLHRADLRSALLQAARETSAIKISAGFELQSFAETGAGIRVTSATGETRDGPWLCGADGIRSRVRGLMFGDQALPVSGYVAYRAVLARADVPKPLADNKVHLWLAPYAHVVHYPVRAGREHAVVVVLEEDGLADDWNTTASAGHVAQKTADLAPNVANLIAAAGDWRKWALADPEPYPKWSKDQTVLIGDAAHPVLPFLAQGGALALEDAAALASLLARHTGDPAAAIAAYQGHRQPRAARVQAAARRNGRIYHLAGISARVRDLVLKARAPAHLFRSYDWLYGWRDWD